MTFGPAGNTVRDNVITGSHMGIAPSSGAGGTLLESNKIFDNGAPVSLCNAGGICSSNVNYTALAIGIDIGRNGATPNDDGDTDAAQNFPVLHSADRRRGGSDIEVSGTLASRPNSTYTVELFASHGLNAAGHAEGETSVASFTVTTDAAGYAAFSRRVSPGRLPRHADVLTATSTGTAQGTSEFSPALALGH